MSQLKHGAIEKWIGLNGGIIMINMENGTKRKKGKNQKKRRSKKDQKRTVREILW